ncbi:MAG: dynamin family protein [Ardenticatenales bacterium]
MRPTPAGSLWLDPRTLATVAEIRAALADLADVLDGPIERADAIHRLRQAADDLAAPLLVVVVGEFNAGKSALINALLEGPYLTEGVTPTTAEVQWLVYSDNAGAAESRIDGDVLLRPLEAPRLAEMAIIDTPGTNAVVREHERLTREFVPRADLVLFVTSADRPFPESERDLLLLLHHWRRRTVIVVNKIDLVETTEQRQEIVQYVEHHAAAVLGAPVDVLAVSARRARAAQAAGSVDADWRLLDDWLREHVADREGLRLKLASPLARAARIALESASDVASRRAVLNADGEVLAAIGREAATSGRALKSDFASRLDTIDARIQGVRERGEAFLDEHMRLVHLRALMNREALKSAFDAEVIGDTPVHVATDINAHIDWLIEQEETRWRSVRSRLAEVARSEPLQTLAGEGGPGFASRRQALLASIGQQAATALAAFDTDAESERLESAVREALAHTALLEVGAVGLGLAITALTAFDATGIAAGTALGVLGLAVLPYRRRRAAQLMRERLADLRADLRTRLSETFDAEVAAFDARMNDLLGPYQSFVDTEIEWLVATAGRLDELRARLTGLEERVATM